MVGSFTVTAPQGAPDLRVNQSPTSAAGSNLFTYTVPSLAINGTYAQGAQLTAPATAGTYYVWVITDNTGTAGQTSGGPRTISFASAHSSGSRLLRGRTRQTQQLRF